jgi:Heat induced stress protein YflT domain
MAEKNAVVGVYNSHTDAEASIKELQRSGFDMKKLSIVGKDYHTEEHVVGYYNAGDRMQMWGKLGAFRAASGACCSARPCSWFRASVPSSCLAPWWDGSSEDWKARWWSAA